MKKLFIYLFVALTITSVSYVYQAAAGATLTAYIGSNPKLNQNFASDVTVNLGNEAYSESKYQLLLFKSSKRYSLLGLEDMCAAASWSASGSKADDFNYFASATITASDPITISDNRNIALATGSHEVRDATQIGLSSPVSFSDTYKEGAYLYYFLLSNTNDPTITPPAPGARTCSSNLAVVASVGKNLPSIGGTTAPTSKPVTLEDTTDTAKKFGTSKTSGLNIVGLRSLFSTSATGEEVEGKDFPILGTILTSLLYLAGLFLLLAVLYSGIILMRATSDDEAATAKKNLVWALTGSVVVVTANWILDTVIRFFWS